ncbi:GNAT family N-acetyltransferase [Sphingobacterium deserti]|uniref:GCN5-related N-acetyltransferase n=1 Tax=Sphingobacterium deserti TaxID=1229276 RepID=A0A0B8T6U0_9SPHI|nr:GNAT family N-acetyltransferase [Sphingobacterium deserti]KGE13135.1 GCN5-related N-acetyltransferase [Sphingobacterium deserti]
MLDDLRIEQIAAAVTWRLRQEVLYPNGSLKDVMITEDFEGFHFGAYHDNMLVGVISLFPDEDSFQFRKFAVQPHVQGQGIGRKLLKYVFSFAKTWDCQMIWCHARETAITFYEKSGMRVAGSAFSKNGIAYVRMEIWL